MELENMKKGICTLKLEKLKKVYNSEGKVDDTLVNAVFSIIDFNVSGNRQLVPKDVCLNSAHTLKFKPLLCKYNESTDYENPNDSFGSHEEFLGKTRDGDNCVLTGTHAIGVSEKEGYLGIIKDENGNDMDVLLASFMLWTYRYPNEISLINEFFEKGETLYTSCEYFYGNVEDEIDENGIKYQKVIGEIIFDGHCLLGSDIAPAYDSSKLISFNSKWNKALNEKQNNDIQNQETDVDIKNDNQKEDASMEGNALFKVLNELSHGDIREKLMSELSKVMTADEFKYVWISNYGIYDSYFIYENYVEDEYKNFKIPYEKMEADIVLKFDEKVEVQRDEVWVEVGAMEKAVNEVKESLDAKEVEIGGLNESIKELNEKVEGLEGEKSDFASKMDVATNEIVDLTKQVNEMKPVVEQFNSEKLEQAINAQKVKFEEKFIALNAKEAFASEEVQELVKKSVCESDEGKEAILSLNSMLVELVKPVAVEVKKEEEKIDIKEFNSKKMENLIDTKDTFETRYFV